MPYDQIEALWEEHCRIPFPRGYAGKEIEGIDLVLLDTLAAGCISTFLGGGGRLDPERAKLLGGPGGLADEIDQIMPGLEGEAARHFDRLGRLSRAVLARVQSSKRRAH